MFFGLIVGRNSGMSSNFNIRLVEPNDIFHVLELDKRVSFEFFAPIYAAHYTQWEFGRNPEFYLSKEFEIDQEMFPQIVRKQYLEDPGLEYRLFGAFDNDICIAIVLVENIKGFIEIKLFFVDSVYRGKGIGKAIFSFVRNYFSSNKQFMVYVLKYGNEKTQTFYQSLGFKNLGPGPANKISLYGVPYNEIFYKFLM